MYRPFRYLILTIATVLLLAMLAVPRSGGQASWHSFRGEDGPAIGEGTDYSAPLDSPGLDCPGLINPGFEEGFYTYGGAPELKVGNGWAPWWMQGTHPLFDVRPEWKDEWIWGPSIRVMEGDFGQKFFTGFSTHTAGFYQRVPVPQGSSVEFSIWVQVWSSDCDVVCISPLEPCRSGSDNSNGNYRISVGIDPLGNVPSGDGIGTPGTVQWSVEQIEYDDWVLLRVTSQAQTDHVTVYTRGRPEWPVKHNDSYWDAASLRIFRDETATPTPTFTLTTVATSTPSVTLTPSVTSTPTDTPTPSLTPTPTVSPTPSVTPTSTSTPRPTETATPTAKLTPSATPTHVPLDKLTYLPLIVRNFRAPPPTITPTTTPSATVALSPTPTSTVPCSDIVSNGGFEEAGGWTLGTTARSPSVTDERAHSGSHSLRLGITSVDDDVETWSFAWQQVAVPADAAHATLSFWIYPLSDDESDGDWQEALLRDADSVPLRFIMFPTQSDSQVWERHTFDLTPYAGQTLQLWFNVYNNGDRSATAMYLDDVAVEVCRGAMVLARPRVQSSTITTPDGVIGISEFRYSPGQLRLGPECDNPDVDLRIEFVQTEVFTGTVDLTGWILSDGVNPPFVFPPLVRERGERVRVWSRGGLPDSPTDLYWDRPAPVWPNDIGIAILSQADGVIRSKFCYGPGVWGQCPEVWPPPIPLSL